jgi:large subunit ribosomal protein L15
MDLTNLKKQVNKTKIRKGRGAGSGKGKTAGRGMDGQKSRSGGKVRIGFEGGQMPLTKRVPKKRGFKSLNVKPTTVTLKTLDKLKNGSKVSLETLLKEGIIQKEDTSVKIVGSYDLKKKFTVSVPTSKGAAEIVKKAGGKVE